MAVCIRLSRMGARKKPFYRVVVIESSKKRDGGYLDNVGYYNPLTDPPAIKLELEKIAQWIKKGAKPSKIVQDLIKKSTVNKE